MAACHWKPIVNETRGTLARQDEAPRLVEFVSVSAENDGFCSFAGAVVARGTIAPNGATS
jgi:hypothetical protein